MLSEQFHKVFAGLTRAYGTYTIEDSSNIKIEGTAKTISESYTSHLWELHLAGKIGLGVIPINDDNKCKWGCIDVDEYNLNLEELSQKFKKKNIIVCRSKSGGAHLFIFTKNFISAGLMIKKLKEICNILNFSKYDLFPRQDKILAERGDTGNWLNMPYFNGSETDRYAIYNGKAISPERFLQWIDKFSLKNLDDLNLGISEKVETSEDLLPKGPPCLQHLIKQGFPEGTRNNGLFNLGVYARKSNPDNWEDTLEDMNIKYMNPPLNPQEVMTIIKSLGKKDYNYTCKDQPICAHCDSMTCQTREFGIGEGSSMPELNSLRKLKCVPPIWFLNVNGKPIELDTEELQKQEKFQKACMEQINLVVPSVTKFIWTKILKKLYKNLEEIEAPESLSVKEQLRGYLEDFCTNRAIGRVKEDLNRGVPWTDEGETYFRYKDFWKFLERAKWKALEHNKTAHRLKEYFEVEEKRLRIYGMNVRVMAVKAFERPKSADESLPKLKERSF